MKFISLFPYLTALLPIASSASLVAYYPLDTDALDASGNGFDGSVVGGTVNFGQAGANGNTGSSAAFPKKATLTFLLMLLLTHPATP